jgi:hypothetical protein
VVGVGVGIYSKTFAGTATVYLWELAFTRAHPIIAEKAGTAFHSTGTTVLGVKAGVRALAIADRLVNRTVGRDRSV